jgi:hypothetical protein
MELIGDKLAAETGFAGDSWRLPVGASEKRAGFGEWAMSAMLAKEANSVLLAALRAVGFVDTVAAASGGVTCVAKCVFGDRSPNSLGGLEL